MIINALYYLGFFVGLYLSTNWLIIPLIVMELMSVAALVTMFATDSANELKTSPMNLFVGLGMRFLIAIYAFYTEWHIVAIILLISLMCGIKLGMVKIKHAAL